MRIVEDFPVARSQATQHSSANPVPWKVPPGLGEMFSPRLERVVPSDHDTCAHVTSPSALHPLSPRLKFADPYPPETARPLPSDHSVPQALLHEGRGVTPTSTSLRMEPPAREVSSGPHRPPLHPKQLPPPSLFSRTLASGDVALIPTIDPALLEKQQAEKPSRHPSLRDGLRDRGAHSALFLDPSPLPANEPHLTSACGPAPEVEVEVTLSSLRGHSQGVSDVIGTLDWDSEGTHFATGGIARKIRVYSLTQLAERKAELLASLEERRSRSSGEDPEDDEGEAELEDCEGEISSLGERRRSAWVKRRQVFGGSPEDAEDGEVPLLVRAGAGGLRRKQKAASTNNLQALCERAAWQKQRQLFLDSDSCASKILCTAAKLSCLQWTPWSAGTIGCGDYDGVFCEWDVETGMCVSERDDHQGQKIWSIRYCPNQGVQLAATASEEGTVKLWSANSENSVGSIRAMSASALCSVDFSEDGRYLVTGGADSAVYLYDVRCLTSALAIMQGHEKTVSYTRFMDCSTVVSTSIDSSLKVWNVSKAYPTVGKSSPCCLRASASASEHLNRRNFTGLGVRRDGLILTGSEENELYGYRYRSGAGLASSVCFGFGVGRAVTYPPSERRTSALVKKPFVSAVSFRSSESSSVAVANSEGTVRVLNLA